jgi:hypothetical protein
VTESERWQPRLSFPISSGAIRSEAIEEAQTSASELTGRSVAVEGCNWGLIGQG